MVKSGAITSHRLFYSLKARRYGERFLIGSFAIPLEFLVFEWSCEWGGNGDWGEMAVGSCAMDFDSERGVCVVGYFANSYLDWLIV